MGGKDQPGCGGVDLRRLVDRTRGDLAHVGILLKGSQFNIEIGRRSVAVAHHLDQFVAYRLIAVERPSFPYGAASDDAGQSGRFDQCQQLIGPVGEPVDAKLDEVGALPEGCGRIGKRLIVGFDLDGNRKFGHSGTGR